MNNTNRFVVLLLSIFCSDITAQFQQVYEPTNNINRQEQQKIKIKTTAHREKKKSQLSLFHNIAIVLILENRVASFDT